MYNIVIFVIKLFNKIVDKNPENGSIGKNRDYGELKNRDYGELK